MNRSFLIVATLVIAMMAMHVMCAVPKNPGTSHYVQTYSFIKPDCQLADLDQVTLDPIYQPPAACLVTRSQLSIGNIYSINTCDKDTATIMTDCNASCGQCKTKTEIPLNKCVNSKEGTSQITYCGAIKYENMPKMIWQNTHVVSADFSATCYNTNTARFVGDKVVNCAKLPTGHYIKRKCGLMFGEQMYEVALYNDPQCTVSASMYRDVLNKCDSYTSKMYECL